MSGLGRLKHSNGVSGGITYTLVGEGLCSGLLAMELALASERIEVLLGRRHDGWLNVVDVVSANGDVSDWTVSSVACVSLSVERIAMTEMNTNNKCSWILKISFKYEKSKVRPGHGLRQLHDAIWAG